MSSEGRGHGIPHGELLWALGSICALHRAPFAPELVAREFPPPCSHATLTSAARALGLRIKAVELQPGAIARTVLPLLHRLARFARRMGIARRARTS